MMFLELLQLSLLAGLVLLAVRPLGLFMARVYEGQIPRFARVAQPLERLIYRLGRVDPTAEMDWKRYAAAVLGFGFVSIVAVYALQRLQGVLPFNPEALAATTPDSSFNTAVSFSTNTNWQGYGGESTMSYLTQMMGLTVQNFLSAAAGMAVLIALIRGFVRHDSATIGNFWVDLTRGVVYILMPLSLVLALVLAAQGVVQTVSAYPEAAWLEPPRGPDGAVVAVQRIAVGPTASQVAIKHLGTNGGGFFNANSAHPLENPTPLTNLLETLSILIIPTALCYTFGVMVDDRRQGWAVLTSMLLLFLPLLALAVWAEHTPPRPLASLGVATEAGFLEGKEIRFGVTNSAVFAAVTTATSCGAVNAMHDSFSPLGGLAAIWLIQLGEVVFGGVGSGLYGMLAFAIVAVFLAGLMVGRTPEYLGKKVGAFEMKMASLVILIPCATVLVGTAVGLLSPQGRAGIANPGPHGFSEVLYAFSSCANNNGSAFAGLSVNTPFYNGLLGLAMLMGRFLTTLPILAIAGALASKKHLPSGPGTLPTHTPLFIVLLASVVVIVGALSFFPALALGPIVEFLMMNAQGS